MQAENLRDYCFKEMMWKSNGMVLKVMLIKNMRPFIRICSRSLMIPVWIAGNQPGTDRNPGCYPTCSTLSIYPLVKEGLIDTDTLIIDAKSGVSGAGRYGDDLQ